MVVSLYMIPVYLTDSRFHFRSVRLRKQVFSAKQKRR